MHGDQSASQGVLLVLISIDDYTPGGMHSLPFLGQLVMVLGCQDEPPEKPTLPGPCLPACHAVLLPG
eukprot:1159553-Pelagomonas_calceolata.AAC.10